MPKGQFKIFPCEVAGIEIVEAATDHAFPRHWHEQYGIGVIHQGAQKSHSGRGMVEAGAGDVITVNPGEVHDGMPIGDAGRSWRMLYFDPSIISEAIDDMNEGTIRTREFVRPVLSDANVATVFQRLFSVMTTANSPELQREELLLQLLPTITRERNEQDGSSRASAAIYRARNLIDDEPTFPVTLADLARTSGLSRFQVLRGFVKATGFTPQAYLMQRRLDLARRLITKGTALAEAAAASGFADQSHMTRLFVRKYGISPGAYAAACA
ncbi:AraC family transcriptional regulator [Phyllobacterium endophyticum]|uniref:AraC family transcriptional regulator n=1 Tax=Phyllobacterium endophyticum TaxID=1149773 RepID=UPI0011C9F57A|nr:AraC family transcriptional regulator [Phyllobacterium endophyticum]TXR50613.1 AraC family transcriptional regulator [Phyllobacterium endophyticum]